MYTDMRWSTLTRRVRKAAVCSGPERHLNAAPGCQAWLDAFEINAMQISILITIATFLG